MGKIVISLAMSLGITPVAISLPPPEDIPEEILRTEVVTEGRSPEDGSVLTAAEYASLQAELAEREFAPEVNEDIQHTIFLLRVLKLFEAINPF
ncbi:hypothetical protein [[Limnothrix rosea] IAM M-220]|uniref:hypothetical protein n=1 Tax=[Limnothrix rosea] IAM M-220 TaxID=454133 RepID=UPI000964E290|nr:hypothetical protein [[Limnothrix rosea] IAM M-220]OKH11995.1 hypothetical protein NIES208_16685 [[Limnothrix rosea] IAM M-220]